MNVGVKFLLAHQHFVLVVLPQSEANALIEGWASGALRLKGTTHLSGRCEMSGVLWAVQLDAVVGMHTIPAEQIQTAQQPIVPKQRWGKGPNGSGL